MIGAVYQSTLRYNGDGVRTSKTVAGDTTEYVLDLAATLPVVISDTDAVFLYGLDIIAQQQSETYYYMHDGQGNELALEDDGGDEDRASRLRWTAPSSGLFFVKVGNWLPAWAGPGTGYDLILRPPRGG